MGFGQQKMGATNMKRHQSLVSGLNMGVLFFFFITGVFASAQSVPPTPTVLYPESSAVSPRLSDLHQSNEAAGRMEKEIHPFHPLPSHSSPNGTNMSDDALQNALNRHLNIRQQPSYPGIGFNGYLPPDPNIAVGEDYIVQVVNVEIAVFSKASGAMQSGYPKTLSSLWAPLGGNCATQNAGDPIAQYDAAADRWLITQLGSLSAPYSQCIAVSQSSDPTGAYYLYSYSFGNNLNDYTKLGVWPTATNSAYLASANLFANGASFVGSALCAFDRNAILSGSASPAAICYTISNDGGFLPSDLDGSALPPANSPGYFLNFETLSSLRLYKLTPNFANPTGSTLSAGTDIAVDSFSEACGGGTCVSQPGTSRRLDSLGDRLMYRLAYRNFGDHEAMVVNHSVTNGSSAGVRWYELRGPFSSTNPPTVYQQGTFAPDSDYRWMGSMAMDKNGDIGLGYSTSSSSTYPAVRFTGRTTSYPLGTMAPEITLQVGGGSQTGYTRWGDYTALRIDPSDDTTFWYTNEYYTSTSRASWKTYIGSFTIVPPAPDFTLSANPSSLTVTQGNSGTSTITVTALAGYKQNVTLSALNCPSTMTCSFNPGAVTDGSGQSTLTIQTTSSTPAGPTTLTIDGTDGTITHTTTVSLTVQAPPADFTIGMSGPSLTMTHGTSNSSLKVTVGAIAGNNSTVTLSASGGSRTTFSFTPNPVSTTTGDSTLKVTVNSRARKGSYTVTVTGKNGSFTHSTSFNLTIN
jgi:hypothetical protein